MTAPAGAANRWRSLTYMGESFTVPSSWPVYNLASEPRTCVRFDRHAVYEGAEGPRASCPAQSIGLTEAVQVQPLRNPSSWVSSNGLRQTRVAGQSAYSSAEAAITHRLVTAFPAEGVVVTVSYLRNRHLAERILSSFRATGVAMGSPTLPRQSATGAATAYRSGAGRATKAVLTSAGGTGNASASTAGVASGTSATLTSSTSTSTTTGGGGLGSVLYLGKGFDACGAPSEKLMAAWHQSSPFRAIGVYLGGANAACPPDTTTFASWVATETAAGWNLVPIYVGPQAPCAYQGQMLSIQPSDPWTEGAQAAADAVAKADSFGMGPGSTLYYDMEAWNTSNATCNKTVSLFMQGWTATLHNDGYDSGMYGSLDSGMKVIKAMYDQGDKSVPDVIWVAWWNGQATTTGCGFWDGSATATGCGLGTDWSNHQRLHQYSSGTVAYGGYTLDIDEDYIDAPTVGYPQPQVAAVAPAGSPTGSRVSVEGTAFYPGATTVTFGGVAGAKVDVVSSTRLWVNVPAQLPQTVDVQVSTTAGGQSVTSSADRFQYVPFVSMAVDPKTGGYWVASAAGNVDNFGATWHGSKAGQQLPAPVVGIADDPLTGGYFLVTSRGNVYSFDAKWQGSRARKPLPAPVVAMAVDPKTGGYYLTTSKGNVYAFGAPWLGSTAREQLPAPVVGMAVNPQTGGYYLTTSKGNVYAFGAPWHGSTSRTALQSPVVGISASPSGGYYLTTSLGNVYNFSAPSQATTSRTLPAPAVSLAVNPANGGYLLATSEGNVYSFGTPWEGSPAANG